MGTTAFPNGVSSYGAPVPLAGNPFAGFWNSKVWFVDGDSGSNGAYGRDASKPLETIGKAISLASAYDTIYVKPLEPATDASDPGTYDEVLTIPYAKHHLSIIGAVNQNHDLFYGPKLKQSTATAVPVVDVLAPRFVLENFTVHRRGTNTAGVFLEGETGYATNAGSVSSHIVNCMMRYGTAALPGVFMEWGYHSSVYGCSFWASDTGVYITGQSVPQRGMSVINCRFMANNGTVNIGPEIRLLGASTEVLIKNCDFGDVPSGGSYIQATGVVDGVISKCNFAANSEVVTADAATSEIKVGSGTLSVAGCTHGGAASGDVVQS